MLQVEQWLDLNLPVSVTRLGMALTGGIDTRMPFAFVQQLEAGCLGEQIGLAVGDVLCAVGGKSLLAETHAGILALLAESRPCKLEVLRLKAGEWERVVAASHKHGEGVYFSSVRAPLSATCAEVVEGPVVVFELGRSEGTGVVLSGGYQSASGCLRVEQGDGVLQQGDRILEVSTCSVLCATCVLPPHLSFLLPSSAHLVLP